MTIKIEATDGSNFSQEYPYREYIAGFGTTVVHDTISEASVIIESLPKDSVNTSLYAVSTEQFGTRRRPVIICAGIQVFPGRRRITLLSTKRDTEGNPYVHEVHYALLRQVPGGLEVEAPIYNKGKKRPARITVVTR